MQDRHKNISRPHTRPHEDAPGRRLSPSRASSPAPAVPPSFKNKRTGGDGSEESEDDPLLPLPAQSTGKLTDGSAGVGTARLYTSPLVGAKPTSTIPSATLATGRRKLNMASCMFPLCVIFWLLLVVVWDMQKVQQLSTVIHNDHKSLWIDMNESIISKVYSPMSLCILDAPDTTLNSVEIRTSCADLNKKERFPFCTVGYSFNKECLGSLLSSDSYYFKDLRDPIYYQAHDYALSAMEQLAKAKWSLVFVGDKVTMQSMNALICALDSRRIPHLRITQNSPSNFTVLWDSDKPHSVEIIFQTLRAIKYSNFDDSHLSGDAIQNFNKNNGSMTTLEFAQMKIANQLYRFKGVAVVANVGSYYNNRVMFREDMPVFMKYLNEIGRHNIAFFRESASQHWNLTKSGYYNTQKKKNIIDGAVSCMPNLDSTPGLDWRNRDALSTATMHGLDNIEWIHFHDITAPLYTMHPYGLNSSSPNDVDCTQYCYFPQMWQPIWLQMYEVINGNEKLSGATASR